MDTLYQLLEWNPVQVGSTFQGGGEGLGFRVCTEGAAGGSFRRSSLVAAWGASTVALVSGGCVPHPSFFPPAPLVGGSHPAFAPPFRV